MNNQWRKPYYTTDSLELTRNNICIEWGSVRWLIFSKGKVDIKIERGFSLMTNYADHKTTVYYYKRFVCDRWFPVKYLCFTWWISENRYAQCFIGHVFNVPNYYTDFNSKFGCHIINCKLKQFWADNVYSDVTVIPRVLLGILVHVSEPGL